MLFFANLALLTTFDVLEFKAGNSTSWHELRITDIFRHLLSGQSKMSKDVRNSPSKNGARYHAPNTQDVERCQQKIKNDLV
jgi:hypothetical protein